jgi:hypothetical protein
MPQISVEQQIKEIIGMAQDDEACFEGFGLSVPPDRRKSEAFRRLQRRVTREMLAEAGVIPKVQYRVLTKSP